MDSSRSRTPLCDLLGIAGAGDLEEGEYVPGDDYYYQSSDDIDHDPHEHSGRMRRLEDIVADGPAVGTPLPPSPTPPSESEGTISDDGASSAGVVVGAPAWKEFPCHVYGKGFSSRKAVDSHMRVHGSWSWSARGSQVVAQAAVFCAGWATTGKRGWAGGKPAAVAASLNSESTGHSTAIVALQPLEKAVPMAFATTNLSPMPSSTRTNLSGEEDEGSSASATATAAATVQPMDLDEPVAAVAVVTGRNPSSTGAVAVASAGPAGDHQLAAVVQAPAAPQVHGQAVVPPLAAAVTGQLHQQGQLVLPQPIEPPREYSCKVCGKTYPTPQGLGGHAAGHRNRQREQDAMAAAAGMMMPHAGGDFLAALRRSRKEEAPHACQKCHKEFPTGVALGGHMRMHYTGPPIVHKSKKTCMGLVAVPPPPPPAISEADLRLALSNAKPKEPQSPAPAMPGGSSGTGRLRLFGIDIGSLGAPSEQQGSSGTKEEGSWSASEHHHK